MSLDMANKVKLISKLKDFFIEFDFSGSTSIRFYNTLCRMSMEGRVRKYILDYFKLIDNPYVEEVKAKMNSKEFANLLLELYSVETDIKINKRFKIYYGAQGGGKTTTAIKENPDAEIMICNSSFEPSDLFEAFDFKDGNPIYRKTALFNAMINGKKIILDEINLLPRDSLRALQGLLDSKECFSYKGEEIHIKEGFEIIGTMNLEVNGQVEDLPAPLVDRAYDIEEFVPSSELIAQLSFGE